MTDDLSLSEYAYIEEQINLRRKLNRAIDVLKFYADSDRYERFGRGTLTEIEEDGGEYAQKVLEEIEK